MDPVTLGLGCLFGVGVWALIGVAVYVVFF